MTRSQLLSFVEQDGRELCAAAQSDWQRPVPQCPGWDSADLVRHMGLILAWMAEVVSSRDKIDRRRLDPGPTEVSLLGDWYLDKLDQALTALDAADPATPVWTFSSRHDHCVRWWQRRLAVEIAIHRWDAQDAAPGMNGAPLNAQTAVAGIEEFLTEFLPSMLTRDTTSALHAGTLHLHATDAPEQWWVDLAAPDSARPQHPPADTELRGSCSDLLLWLVNRRTARVEVIGSHHIPDQWHGLRR